MFTEYRSWARSAYKYGVNYAKGIATCYGCDCAESECVEKLIELGVDRSRAHMFWRSCFRLGYNARLDFS